MKPTAFLAAFAGLDFVTASPAQTGLAAHPDPAPSLYRRGAVVHWDPFEAYETQTTKREKWEHLCGQALEREGCPVGIIHKGVITADGKKKTTYVNVEGGSSLGREYPRKMRVFDDGTTQDGWSLRDLEIMAEAKRRMRKKRKKVEPPTDDDYDDQGGRQKAHLSWRPVDAYSHQPPRKWFWEQHCHRVLAIKGCEAGIIHGGEIRSTHDNGDSYVNIEGAPSLGMEYEKKMRVFLDGSHEDGWSTRDQKSIQKAEHRNRSKRRKTRLQPMGPTLPTQEQDESKHDISWDPPNAYGRYLLLKAVFEKACHQALDREGCDMAIMHRGHHGRKNSEGTKTHFLTVSAGKKRDDPNNTKYMRLFEDGSSEWYPPGPLPYKEARATVTLRHSPFQRPRGRPKKGATTWTRAAAQAAALARTQPPTRAASPPRFQVPRREELDLNFPPADEPASPRQSH